MVIEGAERWTGLSSGLSVFLMRVEPQTSWLALLRESRHEIDLEETFWSENEYVGIELSEGGDISELSKLC